MHSLWNNLGMLYSNRRELLETLARLRLFHIRVLMLMLVTSIYLPSVVDSGISGMLETSYAVGKGAFAKMMDQHS